MKQTAIFIPSTECIGGLSPGSEKVIHTRTDLFASIDGCVICHFASKNSFMMILINILRCMTLPSTLFCIVLSSTACCPWN